MSCRSNFSQSHSGTTCIWISIVKIILYYYQNIDIPYRVAILILFAYIYKIKYIINTKLFIYFPQFDCKHFHICIFDLSSHSVANCAHTHSRIFARFPLCPLYFTSSPPPPPPNCYSCSALPGMRYAHCFNADWTFKAALTFLVSSIKIKTEKIVILRCFVFLCSRCCCCCRSLSFTTSLSNLDAPWNHRTLPGIFYSPLHVVVFVYICVSLLLSGTWSA